MNSSPAATNEATKNSTPPQYPSNETSNQPSTRSDEQPDIPSVSIQPLTQHEKIKAMVKCVNDLRDLGVESDVPLPKICVVGDQSAGKSSLVETLSGIRVPRADGCCTRCPLEVNLISKDCSWKCSISLATYYTYATESQSKKGSRKCPMGPWSLRAQPKVVRFGVTGDREEVHGLIQRAQLAILNPTADPERYAPGAILDSETSQHLEVKFSPNIIRLDIQGPDHCDLSFTDLPGIIAMHEDQSEHFLVALVANLMKENIKHKNSLVILTLSMTNDVENSQAFAAIRVHSAEARTLGVLTKPDRVQNQALSNRWQEILRNESLLRVGRGFHAVMMDPDLTLSREVAQDRERAFFDREEWQVVKSTAAEKLGIPSLTLRLENLLATEISNELPNIVEKVYKRSAEIEQELKRYPIRPSDDWYLFELGMLFSKLKLTLLNRFKGQGRDAETSPLQRNWKDATKDFARALLQSCPQLVTSSDTELITIAKFRPSSNPATPSKTIKSNEMPPSTRSTDNIDDEEKAPTPPVPSDKSEKFTLDYVRERNQILGSTNVPGQSDPRASEDLNMKSTSHWKGLGLKFVQRVGDIVFEEVEAIIADVFTDYVKTEMYKVIQDTVKEFWQNILQDQKEKVVDMYRMEHEYPLTLDDERMTCEKNRAKTFLTEQRLKSRVSFAQAKLDAGTPVKGRPKVAVEKDIEAQPDSYTVEIDIMATVKAYYIIASSRFADNVCLAIRFLLFAKCGQQLDGVIAERIGTGEDSANARARIIKLMSDDPQRDQERSRLLVEKERLERAQKHLKQFTSDDSPKTVGREMDDPYRRQANISSTHHGTVARGGIARTENVQAAQTPGKRKRSPGPTSL